MTKGEWKTRGMQGLSLAAVVGLGACAGSTGGAPNETGATPVAGPGTATPAVGSEAMAASTVVERDRSSEPNFISRSEIEASGARNGWEAVRFNARHLSLMEGRGQNAERVSVQHRGPDSIEKNDSLVLVLDGILTFEMARLRQIPATMIESIEILNASQAVLRYGSDAGGGALIVKTSATGG